MGELNYVFTEIGFDHLHAGSFEGIVEMRLFRRHAFAFDDCSGLTLYSKTTNNRICFDRITRPVNCGATTLGVLHKLFEVTIEMRQRVVFDRARLATQSLPIRKTRSRLLASLTEKQRGIFQRAAEVHIGQRSPRVLPESFTGQMIHY